MLTWSELEIGSRKKYEIIHFAKVIGHCDTNFEYNGF